MNDLSNLPRMAKLFWTGRSQAVRLPKEFRFDGTEVRIRKEDGRVILEPVAPADDGETDAEWAERLAGCLDEETARIILEERPGPETMPEWAHLR